MVEQRIFLNRITAAFILIMLLSVGLVVRLVYLQVVGHEHYATMSKENSIKTAPIAPTRGIIYDRNGKVLADNIPTYTLELIPEQVADMDATLGALKLLLGIPDEKIEQFKEQLSRQKHKPFVSIPLLLRLTEEQVAAFSTQKPFYPGVDIKAGLVRVYPYAELVSHVVGYVGRINTEEMKTLPEAEYEGSHHIGKAGIESAYEVDLHGKAGYIESETNAQSRPINVVNQIEPVSGIHLYLTLDIDLQKTAYDALTGYNGAAVAIAVKTGEVLAFASRPGFDPNPFVYGISAKAYKDLQESEDQPLFNRGLRGQYPPGSTMKPFVALAGLELGATSFQRRMHCPGAFQLPNSPHKFRDWRKGGHGSVNMSDAITQSCDVYFYKLALDLGIDRLHSFLQSFGFGLETGIDMKGEKPGVMPSREWKHKMYKKEWFPGETLITGIGQGYTLITPIQLARATATLANRGKVVQPFLVNRALSPGLVYPPVFPPVPELPLNQTNVTNITNAMVNVVHSNRGTAKGLAAGMTYKMASKTGTAQVFSIKQKEKYDEDEIKFKLRDHALFIAFAPAEDPQIAVAVVVENGGHGGTVAGPIAKKIINQYLGVDKDAH